MPILTLFAAIVLTVSGELMLKRAMNTHGPLRLHDRGLAPALVRVFARPMVLAGFGLVFTASILWLSVVSQMELSVAYPMLSTSYGLVLAGSALVLGERVTRRQWLGVLVITGGVALVFWSGQ